MAIGSWLVFVNVTLDAANDTYLESADLEDMVANIDRDSDCRLASDNSCTTGWMAQSAVEYGRHYHVYLALVVCCFGTVANLLTIAVLTRKDMASAPINRILTAIAIADVLIMLEYVPFGYYYYIELPGKLNFPYWGAAYMLAHMHFSQTMHTVSICLTLTLAIWRYLAISLPERNHRICSESRCTLGILLSYILPLLLCIPTYITFEIQSSIVTEGQQHFVLHHVGLSALARRNNYLVINFWLYAVTIKLLPCVLLTGISYWLIRTLLVAKCRKKGLRACNPAALAQTEMAADCPSKVDRRTERTTRLLVAVVLLFLMTEFPQGIFGLLIGLKGKCFFVNCYDNFGEIIDFLALLNGSINFILYCWMNHKFRSTFALIFKAKVIAKWFPQANSDMYTTYV